MSTSVRTERPKRSIGYYFGSFALWTGFLSFSTLFLAILIPAC